MHNNFLSIEQAVTRLQQGKMLILVDDENRENEGDLIIAADKITPEIINFMNKQAGGLICLSMADEMATKLGLQPMVTTNKSQFQTPFTVSVEAATGVTTGISAKDRVHTIKTAIAADANTHSLVSPGHIFPLKAHKHGVIKRQGHTEGSVDLARLAGMTPACVICEVINDDGSMARNESLLAFAQKHDIGILTIDSIRDYRIATESLIQSVAKSTMPTKERGEFSIEVFQNQLDSHEHFAMIKPPVKANAIPLVRVHSECITGEVLGSERCDCGFQLNHAMEQISQQGGVLIYLRQEGRGIGLAEKIKAYHLQEQGFDTVEANEQLGLPVDSREFAVAYQILKYLGISHIRLITNNPDKIDSLQKYGICVTERIAIVGETTQHNHNYLLTKQQKLGHLYTLEV